MKECKYCRSMYEDSLAACPNCGGNKIVTSEERAEEAALKQKEKENRESAIAAPLKMRKNILIGVGIVIAIIIAIIAIASINANQPYSDGTTKDEATNLLETGMDYYNSGDFEAAIEYFSQLPADSKEYEEAQSMIEKSAVSYRNSILSKADTYVQDEEYDVAIGMLEKALKVLSNDTELKNEYNRIKDLYKKSISDGALSTAKEFVKNNDYENAIKTLQDAITQIGSDEEVSAQLDAYVNSYASSAIDTAKKQYVEYNADSIYAAENIIQTALKLLPDNQALLDAYEYYKEREPIKIIPMLVSIENSDFSSKEIATDTSGKTYSEAMYGVGYDYCTTDNGNKAWWYCYESIELDYQYSKITGVLFHNEKYKTAPVETSLRIEGDEYNEVLWSSSINKSSGAKTFSVDVTGEKHATFEFRIDYWEYYVEVVDQEELEYAYISELYLWK